MNRIPDLTALLPLAAGSCLTSLGPAATLTFARAAEPVTEQEAHEIGVEAYTYLYPLVLTDTTRRQAVNVEPGKSFGRGPMNTFNHIPIFPPADFRDVVRPNFDTLDSIAWLDLTQEPLVVTGAVPTIARVVNGLQMGATGGGTPRLTNRCTKP